MNIAELAEYRPVKTYVNVISQLIIHYVKGDDYALLSAEERSEVVDAIEELKMLLESDIA